MALQSNAHQLTTDLGAAPTAPHGFSLLGELRVTHAGQAIAGPPYRTRSLLAALLLHPGPQRRTYLLGLLYPDLPEALGRKRLSDLVWLLDAGSGVSHRSPISMPCPT